MMVIWLYIYMYCLVYIDFFLGTTLYTIWICRVESIYVFFAVSVFHCLGNPPRKLSWSITFYDYPLVNVYIAKWKDPPSLSSVNQRTKWAIFNSYVTNYRRVIHFKIVHQPPRRKDKIVASGPNQSLSGGFGMFRDDSC